MERGAGVSRSPLPAERLTVGPRLRGVVRGDVIMGQIQTTRRQGVRASVLQPHRYRSQQTCCALSRVCRRPLSLPSCPPSPTSCPRPVSGRGGQGPWGPRGSWCSSTPACGSLPWCSSPQGCSSAPWLLPVPLPMAGDSRWWGGRWCPPSRWGWGRGPWSRRSPCTPRAPACCTSLPAPAPRHPATPQLSAGCRAPLCSTTRPAAPRSCRRPPTWRQWPSRTASLLPAPTSPPWLR